MNAPEQVPADIQLQPVAPMRGTVWLRQGFRVFAHRPLALSLLLSSVVFALFLIARVPVLGPLLSVAVLPLVWLGFTIATQLALRGQVPMPDVFIAPFKLGRPRTIALLKLCLLYVVALAGISVFCHWVDGGAFFELQNALAQRDLTQAQLETLTADPRLQTGVFWRLGLITALAVPFWHAPALIHWGGHGMAKALFFSTVAVWRAKWAFLLHGLTCIAGLIAFGTLSSVLLALLGRPEWAPLVVMPAALLFSSIFLSSVFFTFVDAFVANPVTPPVPPAPPAPEPTPPDA